MSSNEQIEQIKHLKKEGNLDGAVELLQRWIHEEEKRNESYGVAPWPYEQLAIIYRKQKLYDSELAILERYFRVRKVTVGAMNEKLAARLLKSYELNGLIEIREHNGINTSFHIQNNTSVDELDIFCHFGAIIDTETTGLTNNDELIELAIILFKYSKLSGKVLDIVDTYSGISRGATAVHGLTKKDVKGHRIDITRAREMLDKAEILITHNASFDRRYISKLFPDTYYKQWYCSMNGVPWKRLGHDSKSLLTLLHDHQIQTSQSHRALDDAKVTLELLSKGDPKVGKPYLFQLLSSKPLRFDERQNQQYRSMKVIIGEEPETKQGTECLFKLFMVIVIIFLLWVIVNVLK